ncbi:alpha/beta fold hydrolase [Tateyamaria armeniaca]|uniref:Alpha/beta fold hydrolase n=1 Tax=Tateyamaria armeniaca TaxID=2518930 RepID=A0ABW8UNI6_9RHOB
MDDPQKFYLDLKHGRTYCELDPEEGKPMLVCIHGWSTASYVWKGLRPKLREKGYRVLTFDLYGRGKSSRPDVEHTTDLFVDQLSQLLGALNLYSQRLNIVGYSMGGAIAASFVASRVDDVERLLLIAPAGMVVRFPVLRFVARNVPIVFDPILRAGLPKALESQFKDAAKDYPNDVGVQQVLANQLAELQNKDYIEALLSSLKGALASSKRGQHQLISQSNVKVKAIFADQDKTIPHPYAKLRFDKWNQQVVSRVIEGAGHAVTYTHIPEIMAEAKGFL